MDHAVLCTSVITAADVGEEVVICQVVHCSSPLTKHAPRQTSRSMSQTRVVYSLYSTFRACFSQRIRFYGFPNCPYPKRQHTFRACFSKRFSVAFLNRKKQQPVVRVVWSAGGAECMCRRFRRPTVCQTWLLFGGIQRSGRTPEPCLEPRQCAAPSASRALSQAAPSRRRQARSSSGFKQPATSLRSKLTEQR